LIHDKGDARPRQLNDDINKILAFCSGIDAVDVEMSTERVD